MQTLHSDRSGVKVWYGSSFTLHCSWVTLTFQIVYHHRLSVDLHPHRPVITPQPEGCSESFRAAVDNQIDSAFNTLLVEQSKCWIRWATFYAPVVVQSLETGAKNVRNSFIFLLRFTVTSLTLWHYWIWNWEINLYCTTSTHEALSVCKDGRLVSISSWGITVKLKYHLHWELKSCVCDM